MFKVKIFSVHKTKEKWLKDAILEYEKRLSPYIIFDWHIAKDDKDLEKKVLIEKFYICLDEKGKRLTSLDFSNKLFDFFQKNNSKLSFVIGSDTGLTKKLKTNSGFIFSISELTFTHQMTRLIFIEQLYRAIQISKNSKYHK